MMHAIFVLKKRHVYYADQSILNIFHLPLIAGNPKTALTAPGKVTISQEDEAEKYFGTRMRWENC